MILEVSKIFEYRLVKVQCLRAIREYIIACPKTVVFEHFQIY